MKRTSRFAKRVKQDVGSVSWWLILAAGLAAAALAGATVLQHTIHELAANVSSEALGVGASSSTLGSAEVPAVAGTGDPAGGDGNTDGDGRCGQSNPVPEPTPEPTQEEIDYYNNELSAVVLGDRLGRLPLDQDWIPFHDPDERFAWDNAVPSYRHFLEGDGADRTFDMNDYLPSDPAGHVVEQSLLGDASTGTDFALSEFATNGDLPVSEPVSFTLTSDPVTTSETSSSYPYLSTPSPTDWQRTVGGMQVWTTTDGLATRQPDGTVAVSTTTTIHGEDRYNFNWNQQAIDNGEPGCLRERLELGGRAHQYDQTGSTERSDDRTVTLP